MKDTKNKPELEQEQQFVIQRLYTKNISFESPNVPMIFQEQWEPELNLQLNIKHQELDKHIYEVSLTVTAEVKNNTKTAFLAEVEQAGIFTIQGTTAEQLDHALGSFCPGIMFPYAREAISSEVSRGSFPPLTLSPVNFDAIYLQRKEQEAKENK
jgi:preprotein translocase subunit SecB